MSRRLKVLSTNSHVIGALMGSLLLSMSGAGLFLIRQEVSQREFVDIVDHCLDGLLDIRWKGLPPQVFSDAAERHCDVTETLCSAPLRIIIVTAEQLADVARGV